jgi:hypothetical protein
VVVAELLVVVEVHAAGCLERLDARTTARTPEPASSVSDVDVDVLAACTAAGLTLTPVGVVDRLRVVRRDQRAVDDLDRRSRRRAATRRVNVVGVSV